MRGRIELKNLNYVGLHPRRYRDAEEEHPNSNGLEDSIVNLLSYSKEHKIVWQRLTMKYFISKTSKSEICVYHQVIYSSDAMMQINF